MTSVFTFQPIQEKKSWQIGCGKPRFSLFPLPISFSSVQTTNSCILSCCSVCLFIFFLMKIYTTKVTHTYIYIKLTIVSCKPQQSMFITCIYTHDKSAFALFFIWFDWFFFAAEHVPSCSSARFVFLRWVDMQCPVWSPVSALSRCVNLLCVEACPAMVVKGVYRGEAECESVTPTVLTVTEGRGERRTSVRQ